MQTQKTQSCKPFFKENGFPKRILVIRLHAFGDVISTLPYLRDLKSKLPKETHIDLIVGDFAGDWISDLDLFHSLHILKGGHNTKKLALSAMLQLPKFILNNYDCCIDLQNNKVSRLIRKTLRVKSWSEFDKYSAIPSGERTRITIEALGFPVLSLNHDLQLKSSVDSLQKLKQAGYSSGQKLIVLNPVGLYETRQWPLEYYAEFAALCQEKWSNQCFFIVLGVAANKTRTDKLLALIGNNCASLVGKTSKQELFEIISQSDLCVSDDSGLMHLSWVLGRNTIAILGSTREDWTQPLGKRSRHFSSSDLACGNCMKETCMLQTNECLTRVTPAAVLEKAIELMHTV